MKNITTICASVLLVITSIAQASHVTIENKTGETKTVRTATYGLCGKGWTDILKPGEKHDRVERGVCVITYIVLLDSKGNELEQFKYILPDERLRDISYTIEKNGSVIAYSDAEDFGSLNRSYGHSGLTVTADGKRTERKI